MSYFDDDNRGSKAPCPRCGHPLNMHNDAGTFGGGQDEMCCYYNDSEERTGKYQQFVAIGSPPWEPYKCGCRYDGPGTVRT